MLDPETAARHLAAAYHLTPPVPVARLLEVAEELGIDVLRSPSLSAPGLYVRTGAGRTIILAGRLGPERAAQVLAHELYHDLAAEAALAAGEAEPGGPGIRSVYTDCPRAAEERAARRFALLLTVAPASGLVGGEPPGGFAAPPARWDCDECGAANPASREECALCRTPRLASQRIRSVEISAAPEPAVGPYAHLSIPDGYRGRRRWEEGIRRIESKRGAFPAPEQPDAASVARAAPARIDQWLRALDDHVAANRDVQDGVDCGYWDHERWGAPPQIISPDELRARLRPGRPDRAPRHPGAGPLPVREIRVWTFPERWPPEDTPGRARK